MSDEQFAYLSGFVGITVLGACPPGNALLTVGLIGTAAVLLQWHYAPENA